MNKTRTLTPKWRSITPLLVHVASHGETREGRGAALAEIMRMADILDALQGQAVELPEHTAAPRKSEIAMAMAQDDPSEHAQAMKRDAEAEPDMPLVIDTSVARRLDELDGVLG